MQRNKSFLVVSLLVVFAIGASAQDQAPAIAVRPLPLKLGFPAGRPGTFKSVINWAGAGPTTGIIPIGRFSTLLGPSTHPTSLRPLTDDYYTRHFGFFCQKELRIEKSTHIPLRFRLGSLDYCNMLEGKR
ncbi:MAG TPA: hypothetical protein VE035_06595 [Puia sp.]|nr:hypothetical protein [Puia sp.]